MNVIFLDIDGVLCTHRQHVAKGHKGLMSMLDPVALCFLERLCKDHKVKIVISSTWRLGTDYFFFDNVFSASGYSHIDFVYPDYCTKQLTGIRGLEIEEWLSRHPEVQKYCIIDDDSDMLDYQLPFFVQTDALNGMLLEHYLKVMEILGISE